MVDYYEKGYPVNFSDIDNYDAIIDDYFTQFNNSEVRPGTGKATFQPLPPLIPYFRRQRVPKILASTDFETIADDSETIQHLRGKKG